MCLRSNRLSERIDKPRCVEFRAFELLRPRHAGPVLITKTGRGRGAFGSRGCPGTDDLVDFNGKALTAEETQ